MSSEGEQGVGGGNGEPVELIAGVSDLPEGYGKTFQCCN